MRDLGPQIQWVHSYVTDNKIYCVYRAPNEEMIREHAQRGGFPGQQDLASPHDDRPDDRRIAACLQRTVKGTDGASLHLLCAAGRAARRARRRGAARGGIEVWRDDEFPPTAPMPR